MDDAGPVIRPLGFGIGLPVVQHVGFVSTSCDELRDQLEAFATQVMVLL